MRIKKILCGLLLAGLVVSGLNGGVISDGPYIVQAATGKNLKNAKTLNSGNTVTGKIANSSSMVYKFTAPSNGYVTFGIERKKIENTVEPIWNITVMDAAGSGLSEDHGSTFSTQPVMLKQDGICYVVVENYAHSEKEDFQLSAFFTEYNNVIAEPCDKVEEAAYTDADSTFVGVIDSDRDKDYIKITAIDKGYLKLDLKKYNSTSTLSPAWKLNFFDADLNELYSLRTENVMDTMNCEGLYFAIPEGECIYLEIGNAHNSTGVMYSVTSTFTESDRVEEEPNNSFSHANTIKAKTPLKGSLAEKKTGDYFKFKAPSDGKYVVELNLSNEVAKGYRLTLFDAKKDQISTKRDITDRGKLSFKAKKGKTYYVLLEHSSLYKSSYNALYKIKITKSSKTKR